MKKIILLTLFISSLSYAAKEETCFSKLLAHTEDTKICEGFVKNQHQFGSCWTHSGSGVVENFIKHHFGEDVEISTSFIFHLNLLKQIEDRVNGQFKNNFVNVKNVSDKKFFQDGSTINNFFKLIQKYGIRPEYKDELRTFEKRRHVTYRKLKEKLTEALKGEELREELNQYIVEYGDKKSIPLKIKKEIRMRMIAKLEAILYESFPTPTKGFRYTDGEIYTPKSFAAKYGLDKTVLKIERKMVNGGNLDDIYKLMKDRIDNGLIAYGSFGWDPARVDTIRGTIKLRDGEVVSEERSKGLIWKSGHAVQIVGYELDPETKKIQSWIIQNSWGDKSGNLGYFKMSKGYFDAYLDKIGFLEFNEGP